MAQDLPPTTQQAEEAASSSKFETLKTSFIGLVIGAVAVFIVWGGLTFAAEMSQKQIQKEYLALGDDMSRASFAKRHMNHPLGGLVLLGQANEYYNNGNYAAAQQAYAQATQSGLKTEPVLLEQAVLGQAFASYALDPAKGLGALKEIAQNPTLLQSTRAYAAAELAGYYANKGDFKQAKDYMQLVKTFKEAKAWQHQISTIGEVYPLLKE